jgi:asparagine synthase (glutamine-hydrolysing)
MVTTLTHRGPDESGLWLGDGIALGMRRLSIIDVATGQQPVFNEDKTLAVVFNGEIFNYVELRERLAPHHQFATDHSDTEVLVHLYEEHGLDFVSHLNGMFAIALWDAPRRQLILARDRMGIKPLYYAVVGGEIVFGSEPKSLLAHPGVSRDPDFVALHHYFSFKNVPSPLSAFAGIKQLRPGELGVFSQGRLETRRWWSLRFNEDPSLTEQDAAQRIRDILADSVRIQMRSDVPFGAYLSGGVDSSSVVALMSRIGGARVKTFTLAYDDGFGGKDADREFARQVSRQYGTEHYEQVISYRDVPECIDDIVSAFDEPFSGVISTFFITRLIGRHVKVALSGDGADELFGSYLAHRLAFPLAALEQSGGELAGLTDELRAQLHPYANRAEWLAAIFSRGDEAARRMGQYIADDRDKRRLYSERMLSAVGTASTESLVRELLGASGTRDPLNRILFLDWETLLADQVLPFVDRLSMAHSVEVRPPFLDHRLVEFVATIPGAMKIKNGRIKHILKEAVAGMLPPEILDRPKEGFIMPINEWILTNLRSFVDDTLSEKRLARHGLFRNDSVADMLEAHYAGAANYGNRIWNLMMFQLWWDRYAT